MTATAKRQQLMIFLADASDEKVDALYTILHDESKAKDFTQSLEHQAILGLRMRDFSEGKSEVHPWQEVHKRVRTKNESA